MAFQFIPVLKALSGIVATAGAAAASIDSLRKSSAGLGSDEWIRRLEEETSRVGQVTAGIAQQAQSIALELQQQAVRMDALQKKATIALWTSVASACVAVAAVVLALL